MPYFMHMFTKYLRLLVRDALLFFGNICHTVLILMPLYKYFEVHVFFTLTLSEKRKYDKRPCTVIPTIYALQKTVLVCVATSASLPLHFVLDSPSLPLLTVSLAIFVACTLCSLHLSLCFSQMHAEYLASGGMCGELEHSSDSGYGENLFMCASGDMNKECYTPASAMESLCELRIARIVKAILHSFQVSCLPERGWLQSYTTCKVESIQRL